MAPELKRKGGPSIETNTPKRARPTEGLSVNDDTPRTAKSSRKTNVKSTTSSSVKDASDSTLDNKLVRNATMAAITGNPSKVEDDLECRQMSRSKRSQWKISGSIGGRMLDLDPLLVQDEKFIIVAYQRSLRVYSTADSLLHRVVKLGNQSTNTEHQIVSFCLSSSNPDLIWVACSSGVVFCIDWTNGSGADASWSVSETGIIYMTAASLEFTGRIRDIVYTTEVKEDGGWRIQAHELDTSNRTASPTSRTIYASTEQIQIIKATTDGNVILASSGSRILLGQLRSNDFDNIDKIRYTFRIFESSDAIKSLDLRVSARSNATPAKKERTFAKASIVDVVVGDVRGSIFVHNDLLSNLIRTEAASTEDQTAISLMPRKLHWHRKAVNSVKWSQDGNYIISGGAETVIVLWQLDTGKQSFLPHMTAAIQNIVVSPSGTSYALRLGDNSAMVLSTAELTPIANVSGLQTHVLQSRSTVEGTVERLKQREAQRLLVEKTPAVIHPLHPSQLLVAVGDTQEIDPSVALKSSVPYLQTFDIGSSHNISRQALTRTNVTGRIEAPNAQRIDEATVTFMQVSSNGTWLATVDEWVPPHRDLAFLNHGGTDLDADIRWRREVHLKFWKWNDAGKTWELVTRIDAPHSMAGENFGAGRILALTSDPKSTSFSTIGEDSYIRIWRPRTRKRDGMTVTGTDGQALYDWRCQYSVSLGQPELDEAERASPRPEHAALAYSEDASTLAAGLSGIEDQVLYLIDTLNGHIRSARSGLYHGDILQLGLMGQYLIVLSDSLQVYDLVTDDSIYEAAFGPYSSVMSLEQKAQMIHLAVDTRSQTFAVSVPTSQHDLETLHQPSSHTSFLDVARSEIAVFDTQDVAPLLRHRLSSFVTALLPAGPNSEGYLVLDAAAEITPIIPKAVQAITSTAQPLAETHLDKLEAQTIHINEEDIDEPMVDDVAADTEDVEADYDEDMDDGPRVVSQQALAQIFDHGPVFAMPPIEDMFYQVAGLFSNKIAV